MARMLSRRGFVLSGVAVTGGLVVGYGYVALDDGDAALKFAASGQPAAPLNAWLKISPDGTVTCGIHRAAEVLASGAIEPVQNQTRATREHKRTASIAAAACPRNARRCSCGTCVPAMIAPS